MSEIANHFEPKPGNYTMFWYNRKKGEGKKKKALQQKSYVDKIHC